MPVLCEIGMAEYQSGALEAQLVSKRRRRDDLRYSLYYGPGASDPSRRDQIQVELQALDEEIGAMEQAYSRGAGDPLAAVNARLDVLTRIVEGDQATGHIGIRDVVRSLDQLVQMLDKRVSQLFLAFVAMVGLSLLSIVGQIVLLLRLGG